MDLKQIEYFVRVAELGSFTNASIALDIAQPALSRQIRQLEVELRQPLLLRNGRGVSMTESGKIMLDHGLGVLHQVERIKEELSRARGGIVGRVAVGLPPSLARLLTVPLTREFKSSMPDAVLSITEGMSVVMQESLCQGRLDVVVLYDCRPSPEIEFHPLGEQPLMLVQSNTYFDESGPVTLDELADMPLVLPSRPNALRMLLEHEFSSRGREINIAVRADAISTIIDLVIAGIGVAILPSSAVQPALQAQSNLTLRPIVEPNLKASVAWAVSSRRPMTQVQKNVIELIESKIEGLLEKPAS